MGNRANHDQYIGKVCSLLLVQADYIGPHPGARPRGHGELLKLFKLVVRGTGKSQSESAKWGVRMIRAKYAIYRFLHMLHITCIFLHIFTAYVLHI